MKTVPFSPMAVDEFLATPNAQRIIEEERNNPTMAFAYQSDPMNDEEVMANQLFFLRDLYSYIIGVPWDEDDEHYDLFDSYVRNYLKNQNL